MNREVDLVFLYFQAKTEWDAPYLRAIRCNRFNVIPHNLIFTSTSPWKNYWITGYTLPNTFLQAFMRE